MNDVKVLHGEIWLFDPDPTKGTEIGKKIRPGIVISHNLMNSGPSGLVFIVPLHTSKLIHLLVTLQFKVLPYANN